MPERERAYWRNELVTVLDKPKRGKKGKATIRDGFGFTHEVNAKDLSEIDAGEPTKKFSYGSDA